MDSFEDVVKKDRMGFARIRAPEQNQIGVFRLAI